MSNPLPLIKKGLFILLYCYIGLTFACFHKNLWPMWEVNNPLSKNVILHHEWQQFLDKYLKTNEEGINLVDYLHIKTDDLQQLKGYINRLSTINIDDYNRQEQLAYWINLYNAITVYTVATHYPVSSIQDINTSPGLFSVGPWGASMVIINKTPLSLDDIQSRIIRPIWNDARTHYATNNASIGAANLSAVVYQSAIIDEQLNKAATTYINSLRGVQVIEGRLILSKIYYWFEEDFGSSKANVVKHLLQFAKEPLRSQLKHVNTIDRYVYNWHLNSLIPPN